MKTPCTDVYFLQTPINHYCT